MSLQVSIPDDKEFRKLLKETLDQPDEWYEERVERAVKGERRRVKRAKGRAVRVSRKG